MPRRLVEGERGVTSMYVAVTLSSWKGSRAERKCSPSWTVEPRKKCQQKLQQTFPILLMEDIRLTVSHLIPCFWFFRRIPKVQCPWRWCQPLLGSSAVWKVASDEWHQPSSWDSACPGRWKIDDTNEDGGCENESYVYLRGLVCMCGPKKRCWLLYINIIRIKETSLCNMARVQKKHPISTRKLNLKKSCSNSHPPIVRCQYPDVSFTHEL